MDFKIANPPRWKVKLIKNVGYLDKGFIVTAFMKKPLDGLWFKHGNREVNLLFTDFIIIERVI